MNPRAIHVGLSAWIVQDGNYGDFERGQRSRFALEFYAPGLSTVRAPERFLTHLAGGRYRGRGRVVFASPNAWVVDFGVLAYRDEAAPKGVRIGSSVEGDIYLGIDPFFYFEGLWKLPGMPGLVYELNVDEILLETTPWRVRHSEGGTFQERVPGGQSFQPVVRTNAWEDDGGNAHYVLSCSITGGPSSPVSAR